MRLSQAKRRWLFWLGILSLLGAGIGLQARAQLPGQANDETVFIQAIDLTRVDVLLDDIAQLLNVSRPESRADTDSGPAQLARHFAHTRENYLLLRRSACQTGVQEACPPSGEIARIEQLKDGVEPLWSLLCARAPLDTDKTLCQTE